MVDFDEVKLEKEIMGYFSNNGGNKIFTEQACEHHFYRCFVVLMKNYGDLPIKKFHKLFNKLVYYKIL